MTRSLSIALFTAFAAAAPTEVYDGFSVDFGYDSAADRVNIFATVPDGTWLGLTLGEKSMWFTDMVIFEAGGNSSGVTDLAGEGYWVPSTDFQQDWESEFDLLDGVVTFRASR
jgi:hypothetical protein